MDIEGYFTICWWEQTISIDLDRHPAASLFYQPNCMSTELTWNQTWKEHTCILLCHCSFSSPVLESWQFWKGHRAITVQTFTKYQDHLYLAVSISIELSHVDLNAFGILQACTQKGNQTKQITCKTFSASREYNFNMKAKVWACVWFVGHPQGSLYCIGVGEPAMIACSPCQFRNRTFWNSGILEFYRQCVYKTCLILCINAGCVCVCVVLCIGAYQCCVLSILLDSGQPSFIYIHLPLQPSIPIVCGFKVLQDQDIKKSYPKPRRMNRSY